MRIINYNIENFGVLKNAERGLSDGLNEFFRPNGEGKTTLAAFLRAMLYGMGDYKAKSKNNPHPFCERTHYYPFDRGKYGGSVEIEAQGKLWRIERWFDEKKSINDVVKLFCDDEEVPVPKNGIGETILGIDEESFARTLFIDRTDLEISAGGSISAKLNDFAEDPEGGSDFETAMKRVEELLKKLKKGQGPKNKPKIKLLNEKTDEIDRELANAEVIAASLEQKYTARNNLAAEADALQKRADAAVKINIVREAHKRYNEYLKDAEDKENAAKELKAAYKNGVPSESELKTLEDCAAKEIELTAKLNGARPADEDKAEFERLKNTFANGVPDTDIMEEKRRGAGRIKILENSLQSAKERTLSKRESELSRHFQNGTPADEEIEKAKAYADEFRSLRREYEEIKNAPPAPEPKNSRAIPLFAAAALLIIAGVGLFVAVNKPAGAVLAVIGVLLAAAVGAADFSARLKRLESGRENAALKDTEDKMNACINRLVAFNALYGYASAEDAVYVFDTLKSDISEYAELCQSLAAEEKERKNQKSELSELKRALGEFFAAYGADNDDKMRAYDKLADEIKSFAALEKKLAASDKEVKELTAELDENTSIKNNIVQKYALDTSNGLTAAVTAARKAAGDIEAYEKAAGEFREKAETLKREKQLGDCPEGESEDVDAIQSELKNRIAELAKLDNEIGEAESDTEVIPELKAQRAECAEKKAEYEAMYALYEKVGEYFAAAEKNIKSRYIDPVKNSYLAYASALEEALGEKVKMDREYRITFEKNGEYRNEKHLSAGQLCMCALCFRLALTDNMFRDEKPFIIMDDPFADLDGTHMQKAAELVKKLAADRQIIYFCCHESRKIN